MGFNTELPEILIPESAVSKRQEQWRICGYCESWLGWQVSWQRRREGLRAKMPLQIRQARLQEGETAGKKVAETQVDSHCTAIC